LAFEFQLTARKRYGNAASLDAAKAAFKAEYELRESGVIRSGGGG
jgi:hypothetical protein